jgi:phospholipid/cholesterol/gamma-HCH transport system substrate-binding protein
MAKETMNNVKLGIFISCGLAVLVISLYLIGKNQSFFGSSFHLRARFANVNGLMAGNNVRFDGIQAGTVNKITVMNDTTIELDLNIQRDMRQFIRKNSFVAVGNDGLMGNKVINISPNRIPGPDVDDGDLLIPKKAPETDDMMQTFSNTNANVEKISESLINTMDRINSSKAFWSILNDSSIAFNLSASMANVKSISNRLNDLSSKLNSTVDDIKNGRGTVGMLLNDKSTEDSVRYAINNIEKTAREAADAMDKTDSLIARMQRDYAHGHGPLQAMLKDSSMVTKMSHSLSNIEKGTASFSQDMEALKHNFLTKKYFRKQAKMAKDTAQ